MTKITKNFSDKEVLPRELHGYRWEWFIDFRIVEVAQKLRDIFGSITINNERFKQKLGCILIACTRERKKLLYLTHEIN